MRGVTLDEDKVKGGKIFQPALPMRGVTIVVNGFLHVRRFQPALPMRGVTAFSGNLAGDHRFQPALPMRGVTFAKQTLSIAALISTRTPHAGSDLHVVHDGQHQRDFNPHSPCGE